MALAEQQRNRSSYPEGGGIVLQQPPAVTVSETAPATPETEHDLFKVAIEQFDIAADVLGLDDDMR